MFWMEQQQYITSTHTHKTDTQSSWWWRWRRSWWILWWRSWRWVVLGAQRSWQSWKHCSNKPLFSVRWSWSVLNIHVAPPSIEVEAGPAVRFKSNLETSFEALSWAKWSWARWLPHGPPVCSTAWNRSIPSKIQPVSHGCGVARSSGLTCTSQTDSTSRPEKYAEDSNGAPGSPTEIRISIEFILSIHIHHMGHMSHHMSTYCVQTG